jgi:hypothetical protein
MQVITKIMFALIILWMLVIQFYQGETISQLQDRILDLTKNQAIMNETDQMNINSIKDLTQAINTQTKTIRTILRLYR